MMKFTFLALIIFISSAVFGQDSLQARIILIGDAGELTKGRHPVVDAARKLIPLDAKTTVVYLGDNLYKSGLPDDALPTYAIAKAPLDSQIRIAAGKPVKVYFIPGNHDWANGGVNGLESILRVQSYIDVLGDNMVAMLPRDGCAGPVEVKINKDITLITMDSQWWLQEFERPGIESDCPYKTKDEIITELEEILDKNADKIVLLATHHPFKSYGPHGGYFTLKQHLFPFTDAIPGLYFPLPLIGSAYPLTRAVFGTAQDLKHPLYQEMINRIDGVVKGRNNIIHISGHEHALQLIQDSGQHYIVSGSGCKTTRVSKGKNTKYHSPETGFAVLNIFKNKKVDVVFYEVNGDSIKKAFDGKVLDFAPLPILPPDTVRKAEYAFKDHVVISASDRYKKVNWAKRLIFGKNYRKEWSQPVTLKVFNIQKEKGGLTIKSLGGGKQTKSLRLTDKNGLEWTLRTVDKDPEKALPENLRNTLAQSIVQDMISASYPYAPLVIPDLARAVNIPTSDPLFFFVPDDPALGKYRPMFANTVCMLENRDPTKFSEEAKSTDKVLNKMYEDNEHHIDQEKVLNARLLDMLIADFDRHAGQWRWGTDDTGRGKLYYPLPRDRDQAFFRSDGLLVKSLSKNTMPFLEGFNKSIKSAPGMNFVAKDFDRLFLNNINEESWRNISKTFVSGMADSVILKAVKNLPPEILALNKGKIEKRLMKRRDKLEKKSFSYYKFLSRKVNVVGSNENEYFHFTNDPAGLHLKVFRKENGMDSSTVMFDRIFNPKYTKELRIYALNGEDKIEVDPDVSQRIKLRLVGGKGKDTFDLKGNIRSFIYDQRSEQNVLLNTRKSNNEISSSTLVNNYERTGFKYNEFLFPVVKIGFNPEDKLFGGVGFNWTTHGFRKEPFATSQKFTALYAFSRGAYQLRYDGIFNHIISKEDVIVKLDLVNPTLDNFFGYGNNTKFDKSLRPEYYRVRYKRFESDLLIRKRFNNIFNISIGPSYYQYWSDFNDNKNRILSNPLLIGQDSANVYSEKRYLGGKVKFDINYLNNERYPTRGITWLTEFTALRGFNNNTHALTKITSDMTVYASIKDPSRVYAVFRLGGGHIFSEQYEYFQALTLGANNFMRGFRKNRFTGSSLAYGSTELRFKLFKSKSYILPGDFGVLGFYDIGRVWLSGENSKKWHSSYGGGFYIVPYNYMQVSATIGISDEDKLFNFTLGTRFNLTFGSWNK